MIDHQQPPRNECADSTDSNLTKEYVRIGATVEAMRRDGVELRSIAYGPPYLSGANAELWGPIVEPDTELIERFINGVPFDDPPDAISADEIRKLMETYGVKPSMSSRDLHAAKIETKYLVDNCLVAGQHCVVAGPSKTMKTSIAIDLALSLALPLVDWVETYAAEKCVISAPKSRRRILVGLSNPSHSDDSRTCVGRCSRRSLENCVSALRTRPPDARTAISSTTTLPRSILMRPENLQAVKQTAAVALDYRHWKFDPAGSNPHDSHRDARR